MDFIIPVIVIFILAIIPMVIVVLKPKILGYYLVQHNRFNSTQKDNTFISYSVRRRCRKLWIFKYTEEIFNDPSKEKCESYIAYMEKNIPEQQIIQRDASNQNEKW